MCYTNTYCCFCIAFENACLLCGTFSFVISLIAVSASIIILFLYHGCLPCAAHFDKYPAIVMEIIIPGAIVLGSCFMVFSLLLVIGVKKNRPNLVLSYFTFGTLLTIVLLLSALLVLIEGLFFTALVMFILSSVNIFNLVVVHTTYDRMQIRNGMYQPQTSSSDQDFLVQRAEMFGDDEDP